MNKSQIGVFGQTVDKGSDELFKYICCLCDEVGSFKEAKHYCGHCDILYCENCLNKDRQKHLGHKIVPVSDWGEDAGDRCPACCRRKISQHCIDHGQYCCYQCADDKHSDCETISEITQLARGVYASRDFKSIDEEVVDKTNATELLTSNKKKAREKLQKSKQTSIERLKALRKNVNDIFDKLEEDAADEINEHYDEDDYGLESDIEECESVLANLRCLRMYLGSKSATELQMLLKLGSLRVKLKDFDRQLEGRESSQHNFEEYEFIEDPKVIDAIERIETLKLKKRAKEPEPPQPEKSTCTKQRVMTGKTVGRTSGTQRNETTIQQLGHTKEDSISLKSINTSHQSLKTALNIEAPPEMNLNLDVRMLLGQNEFQNIQKDQLHREQTLPMSSRNQGASSQALNTCDLDYKEVSQKSVMSNSLERTTATQTAPKSTSPPHGNETGRYETLNYRKSREDTISTEIQFDIRLPDDTHTCDVQGMFGLPNGNMLLSDTKNKKIKLLDQSYQIIASCELTAGPRGVSEAGENQAVAALDNMRIQFVNIIDGTILRPSRYVPLRHDCYGISHWHKTLYVTEQDGKCIYVYDTTGNLLRNISGRDMDGSPRFERTQQVYITRDGTRIYVTDAVKGLVIVSPKGRTLAPTFQSGLSSACGVCTDRSGNVYVSGLTSKNVIQICDRGAGMQRIVATKESGVNCPLSLWFNSFKYELIVSNNSNSSRDDFLNVYKVK